jgi:hypothetical protein
MTRAVEEFSGNFKVPDMALLFCAELLTCPGRPLGRERFVT